MNAPTKTPRPRTASKRGDDTRIRTRNGRYVAECKHCECPDGCACDGEGCPCGTSKPSKKVTRSS